METFVCKLQHLFTYIFLSNLHDQAFSQMNDFNTLANPEKKRISHLYPTLSPCSKSFTKCCLINGKPFKRCICYNSLVSELIIWEETEGIHVWKHQGMQRKAMKPSKKQSLKGKVNQLPVRLAFYG